MGDLLGAVTEIRGVALVVDDVPANRKILQALLIQEGYQTLAAENGSQAVSMFEAHQPDIIFMDAMMPVMDGYEAATRIKSMAGTNFVPIIFLTALNEQDAMVKCIESGGDDFLSKPFRQEIMRAKIRAMERIRDLSRVVEDQRYRIERQHQLLLKEQIMAQQIYQRAVTSGNVASKYIQSLLHSASIFSGDMFLTADSPDGGLYVMLGDFTGHGLTAAVGVLPAAEVFRATVVKGLSPPEILSTINAKLNKLLPTGMFLATAFIKIDSTLRRASVWNAGMPEVILVGRKGQARMVKDRAVSQYLPLGIVENLEGDMTPVTLELEEGDCLLLCSDGLSEAVNSSGEVFGLTRYEMAAVAGGSSYQEVVRALDEFCGELPYKDDVSFVAIQCSQGLLKSQ